MAGGSDSGRGLTQGVCRGGAVVQGAGGACPFALNSAPQADIRASG